MSATAPAGWYPVPEYPGWLYEWDGERYTGQRRPEAVETEEPAPQPAPAASQPEPEPERQPVAVVQPAATPQPEAAASALPPADRVFEVDYRVADSAAITNYLNYRHGRLPQWGTVAEPQLDLLAPAFGSKPLAEVLNAARRLNAAGRDAVLLIEFIHTPGYVEEGPLTVRYHGDTAILGPLATRFRGVAVLEQTTAPAWMLSRGQLEGLLLSVRAAFAELVR